MDEDIHSHPSAVLAYPARVPVVPLTMCLAMKLFAGVNIVIYVVRHT